jgi:hypothetical protein
MAGALEALTRNVNFVETGSTVQMYFIIVQHSVANNSLMSNEQFRFRGSIVKVNCI